MKKIITIILIIQSTLFYSQFFIGNTKAKVKAILKEQNIIFTEDVLTEETNRISWLNKNEFQMIWVFDKNDKVIRQTLVSEKENGINDFIKKFNNDFVIISDTKWRNYSRNLIYEIELENLFGEYIFSIIIK